MFWNYLYSGSAEEFNKLFSVEMMDASLIINCFCLMGVVTIPGLNTFKNLKSGTSVVLKLKEKNGGFKMSPAKEMD